MRCPSTYPCSSHRPADVQRVGDIGELLRRLLRAAVGVEDRDARPVGRRGGRLPQGLFDQVGQHVAGHRIPDNLRRETVQDGRQTDPAPPGLDVGDVPAPLAPPGAEAVKSRPTRSGTPASAPVTVVTGRQGRGRQGTSPSVRMALVAHVLPPPDQLGVDPAVPVGPARPLERPAHQPCQLLPARPGPSPSTAFGRSTTNATHPTTSTSDEPRNPPDSPQKDLRFP